MASNAHGSEMLTLPSKVPGQPDRKKPKVVNNYNQAMGGVDKADQLGVYYCFQLKSFKWWKKVFFWFLEVAVVNSYLLHKETISRPLSHLGFRRSLIKLLVSTIDFAARPRPGRHRCHDSVERPQPGKHFLSTGKRRDCVVCSNRESGERHLTKYYCCTCSNHPPLHPENCFEDYHTAKRLKKPRES